MNVWKQMYHGAPRPEWKANPAMMAEYLCGCIYVWEYPFPSAVKMGQCPDHPGHRVFESIFLPPVTKDECHGPG